MSATLLAFIITLVFSSILGVVTVRRTARQRSWLEEIESRKSTKRADSEH